MQQTCDRLILSLAKLFVGNQVDTEAVSRSLELICEVFPFECGLIYEVDNSDHFCLKEHTSHNDRLPPQRFFVKQLKPEHRRRLAEGTVSYMTKGSHSVSSESELLELFSANALAIASVADENRRIHGLIVFYNADLREPPSDAELNAMNVPLSMLVKYVAIRMYQNKLFRAQTSLEDILDNTGIDIYVNDFYNHDILYVNKSMAAPYGGQSQFLGKKCWQVLYPGQDGPCEFCPEKKLIDEQGEPTKVYTWDYQRPFDGSWFRVFSAAFRWADGRLAHVVSSADITDNKQKEALIQYLADYDSLTNLPNRRMLVRECEQRIDRATETEKGYLLFFDIDGFKAINDRFGHDAGDEFLVKLAEFFTDIPLLQNAIYRHGGDEFVAVIGGETITKADILKLADYILTRFQRPWTLKCGDVSCNTSIGVSCFPEDGRNAEGLLSKADRAMYRVKKSGGGRICFSSQEGAF